MNDLIGLFLKDKKIDEFAEWAFGPNFKNLICTHKEEYSFRHAWNKLHGDKLMLEEMALVQLTLPRMIELWKNR